MNTIPTLDAKNPGKIFGYSVWDAIGNTPIIMLNKISCALSNDIEIYAKAEWQNPGGSVKDRAAKNIILEAERSGTLTKDKIILDASSGNTV